MIEVTENNKGTEKKERDYPLLKKTKLTGQIVFFTEKNTGMAVNGKGLPIGTDGDGWIEENFELYSGSITLQNKVDRGIT